MKKTSKKKVSNESIFRKLGHLPWTIHVVSALAILFMMFWIENTNPWNAVIRILAILYIYVLSFVGILRSSRQPSHSILWKRQIVTAIVVWVETIIQVWKWFLIPASDFHALLFFLNTLSTISFVLLVSELFYSWP